ncbi:DUF2946 family protein [Paramagnetospirillum kuznetsovii]|uniref:DUF2946 family protein n=1 Tax=Paramagnetospirillum kuznetsovii TaxID=2053833 RepID=UPI001EFDCB01|nr:DUF2946 family protein [Paramagnetospirillum kuznetsovii]
MAPAKRFAAWVGVLALALQILLPLAPVQAALSVDQELAASICHSPSSDSVPAPAQASHDHCQFCQIHVGAKLLAPAQDMSAVPRLSGLIIAPIPLELSVAERLAGQSHTPRGPPTVLS